MKITASHSLKLPVPGVEYGSMGASVSIEGEPPPEIRGDRQMLADYVRRLLAEAKQRTEEHLAAEGESAASRPGSSQNGQSRRPHRPMRGPNGRSTGNGQRRNDNGHSNGEYASGKQLAFLKRLAQDRGLGYGGLQEMAQDEFGMDDLLHLTKRQASQLIDELRPDERR